MGSFLRRRRIGEPPPEDRGVWQIPARFNFTRDVVEALAATDPNRPALTSVDRVGIIDRRTFKEVADDANRWAALLRARGLVPGDRLLVCVGSTPAWPTVILGALKAGLVVAPCAAMSDARDLATRVEHSGARLVVVDRERQPEVVRMRVPVTVVVVEDVRSELRELAPLQPTHDTAADDVAFILYTSGTTNEPKGATHTHGYTWAQRLQAEHWLGARPGDRVWCTARTDSAQAIWNVLLGPWSCGAETVMHEGVFDAEQRLDLVDRLGVTVLCQPPTEYRLMARLPALEAFDLGRVRQAVSTGDRLEPDVIEAFREAFGLTVRDGYGQTENTLLVANAPGAEVRPGSMGLPTPGHHVAVIDHEGNEQPPGREGQIALRGRPPSLMREYWKAPDETSPAFRGEWYVTGDRATRDVEGYFWFTGRVADLKALVVPRPGAEPSDELGLALNDRVTAVMAPSVVAREIEFVSVLPTTATGKVGRVELAERHADGGVTTPVPTAAVAENVEPVVPRPESAQESDEVSRAGEEERQRTREAKAAAAQAREDERQRTREAKAAAEKARRTEAAAQKAAAAVANEEERRRAQQAKAAAEEARRADAEARKTEGAAAAQAREDERQRTRDAKAAAEGGRRAEAEARDAERRAERDRRATEAVQRAEERRARKAARRGQLADSGKHVAADARGAQDGAGSQTSEDRPNQVLMARLRAYSHHDHTEDGEPPAE